MDHLSLTRQGDPTHVKNQCISVGKCLSQIHTWLAMKKLKLNSEKTEIMLFETRQKLTLVDILDFSMAVTGSAFRNLGVTFDSSLSMTP